MAVGMRGCLLVLTLGLAMAATSSAAIYKVGDASGWTILGNINYANWTAKKTFHVGDIIGKFSLLSLKFNCILPLLPSCTTFFEYHRYV